MKAVVQRVYSASCKVDEQVVGEIGKGLLVFFCAEIGDNEKDLEPFLRKIINLRIFRDENDKMNKSVQDICGEILFISQFTLAANFRKGGNRPSFDDAMEREGAIKMYQSALSFLSTFSLKVKSGVFGAHMDIDAKNDGPVTIILESKISNSKSHAL